MFFVLQNVPGASNYGTFSVKDMQRMQMKTDSTRPDAAALIASGFVLARRWAGIEGPIMSCIQLTSQN